jgi:ABC-2 type transport system permease protein
VISYGTWTLFAKEVRRFARVPGQTLLSPVITTALYFVVFGWSLGGRLREIEGIPYARFIVPGLVALGVMTNAYANTSSSLFVMKLQGTVVDLLVSPLTYGQILSAFVAAAVVRALLVGAVTFCVAGLFEGFGIAHPALALAVVVLAAILFAALGLVTAIWASSFEQVNFIPTFFITPLTFLGGVFYSVEMLPPTFRSVTLANPIFYMVDSLRFGMLGISDAPPWTGAALLGALAAAALAVAYGLLRSGYELRG